jgi:hypothetical protein
MNFLLLGFLSKKDNHQNANFCQIIATPPALCTGHKAKRPSTEPRSMCAGEKQHEPQIPSEWSLPRSHLHVPGHKELMAGLSDHKPQNNLRVRPIPGLASLVSTKPREKEKKKSIQSFLRETCERWLFPDSKLTLGDVGGGNTNKSIFLLQNNQSHDLKSLQLAQLMGVYAVLSMFEKTLRKKIKIQLVPKEKGFFNLGNPAGKTLLMH